MKRYSLMQARGGDFTFASEGIAAEGIGNDVIDLKIKKGTISLIVPAETPDGCTCEDIWYNKHACIELELEDGTRLTGWVRAGEAYLETQRH